MCRNVSGAHTNAIEGAWKHAKEFIKKRTVRSDEDLQMSLNVYMWLRWKAAGWEDGKFLCFLNELLLSQ